MKDLWLKFTAWLAAKGGALHVLVVVYGGAALAYGMSPAFKELVLNAWGAFPHWLQLTFLSATQILAIYGIGTAAKNTGQAVMLKFKKKA